MAGTEVLAVTFGLGCALSWGAADFSGGVATKTNNVLTVLLVSQLFGVAALVLLAAVVPEPAPGTGDLLMGGAAGLAGALGIIALYRGLSDGSMGIVAPVSAVVTALLPIVAALFIEEGLPGNLQMIGFALALGSVCLLSGGSGDAAFRYTQVLLAVAAGAGFGLFFVLMDQAGTASVLRPLIAARCASIGMAALVVFGKGRPTLPSARQIPVIALAGILDTAGNAFFVLATRMGRLDMAAVLGSLYPAATVLLAWSLLHERITGRQWTGIATGMTALCLIAAP